jgi:hypothetical protein
MMQQHGRTHSLRQRRQGERARRLLRAGVWCSGAIGIVALIGIVAMSMMRGRISPPMPTDSLSVVDVDESIAPAAADRPVYLHSVIAGGAYTGDELQAAIVSDAVVAAHHAGVNLKAVRPAVTTQPRLVYMSYRKGDDVFWTKHRVRLPAGEAVLTDGVHDIRARCGNAISDVAQQPTSDEEPAASEFDSTAPPPAPSGGTAASSVAGAAGTASPDGIGGGAAAAGLTPQASLMAGSTPMAPGGSGISGGGPGPWMTAGPLFGDGGSDDTPDDNPDSQPESDPVSEPDDDPDSGDDDDPDSGDDDDPDSGDDNDPKDGDGFIPPGLIDDLVPPGEDTPPDQPGPDWDPPPGNDPPTGGEPNDPPPGTEVKSIPEPSMVLLVGAGGAAALLRRWRRRR